MKRPGTRHYRKHSEVFSPSLHGSELFWLHEENLHSIRQVVRMFCLIAVTGHTSCKQHRTQQVVLIPPLPDLSAVKGTMDETSRDRELYLKTK